MGCTTSVILFKGIRTVFERNCAYMCKQQGEGNALEQTAHSWSREDSELMIASLLVNAVSLASRQPEGSGWRSSSVLTAPVVSACLCVCRA